MPASIRDVAAAAGVSKSTASLALRHHPSVADETRRRVEAAALKLGYSVNPLVAALMTQQRTGRPAEGVSTIALVDLYGALADPSPKRAEVKLPPGAMIHLSAGHAAARAAAAAHGYNLDIVSAREAGMTPARLQKVLHSRGVRGVVLMMPPEPETPPAWTMDWSGCAVVHLGSPSSPFHHVRPNVVSSVELLWREFDARGYRRPGLCVPEVNERYSGHRWQMAFRQQALLRGLEPYDFTFPPENLSRIGAWVRRERIDVVCFMGADEAPLLQRAGLAVPEELGYVGLHLLQSDLGKVAGIDLRYDLRYRAAVQFLDSLLRHNEIGLPAEPLAMTVTGRWVDGPTVRPWTK